MIRKNDESLHIAAQYGRIEEIKDLVKKGIPVDISDNDGNTPLQHIVRNNLADSRTVKTLIDLGANTKGWFALGEAALCGNSARVKQLFDHNPDLINEKLTGQTVLDATMTTYRIVKKELDSQYSVSVSKELDSLIRTVSTLVQRGADISEYEYMIDYHPEENPEIVKIIMNASKLRSNYTYFKKHHIPVSKRNEKSKIAETIGMQYE